MRIADHEANAPTGHVVALAHREELNCHVFRARHLHDARRFVAVKAQVGVGQVMHDPDTMLFCERNDFFEEWQINARRGRV